MLYEKLLIKQIQEEMLNLSIIVNIAETPHLLFRVSLKKFNHNLSNKRKSQDLDAILP